MKLKSLLLEKEILTQHSKIFHCIILVSAKHHLFHQTCIHWYNYYYLVILKVVRDTTYYIVLEIRYAPSWNPQCNTLKVSVCNYPGFQFCSKKWESLSIVSSEHWQNIWNHSFEYAEKYSRTPSRFRKHLVNLLFAEYFVLYCYTSWYSC